MAANPQSKASRGTVTKKGRHVPQRSCVACGRKLDKRQLVRVVRTPEGAVMADPTGKAAGRGAYMCWSTDCWTLAVTKGGLERSLKVNLSSEDEARLMAFYEESAPRPLARESK